MGLKITDLLVANYMTAFPISVQPDVSFKETVDFMVSKGIGTLIVMEPRNPIPIGLLTEREVLEHTIFARRMPNKQVKDVLLQPFIKISPDTIVLDAAKTMISKKSRLLVFADDDKLLGIITASDMVRAFRKTDYTPSLENVISMTIYKCEYHDSILNATKLMHEKRIGSVMITREGSEEGIFTERDLLSKVLANNVDMNLPVWGHSSYPIITADMKISAKGAAGIMAANNIKRLVLTKDSKPVGMVTARDIVDAFQMEMN